MLLIGYYIGMIGAIVLVLLGLLLAVILTFILLKGISSDAGG